MGSSRPASRPAPRTAIVLGGGGNVGMAYHVGVLRAFAKHGFAVDDADLVVGTSAGAVIAAYLRTGGTLDEMGAALSESEALASKNDGLARMTGLRPAWRSLRDLAESAAGSMTMIAGTALPSLLGSQAAAVPKAGLFAIGHVRAVLTQAMPDKWPAEELWLPAIDVKTRKTVLLGKDPIDIGLRDAVSASAAVPGIYPPVRADGRTLIDGGLNSVTHLDAVADHGAERILAVAPLAYDPAHPLHGISARLRRRTQQGVQDSIDRARRIGAVVVAIRPTRDELELHGMNPFKANRLTAIAAMAEDTVGRLLASDGGADLLADLTG